jgi:hypothetical protein
MGQNDSKPERYQHDTLPRDHRPEAQDSGFKIGSAGEDGQGNWLQPGRWLQLGSRHSAPSGHSAPSAYSWISRFGTDHR